LLKPSEPAGRRRLFGAGLAGAEDAQGIGIGARAGGESHFTVKITSNAFTGASRLQRQRQVYAALAEELAGPVHALSVQATAPGEG
jgi:stress-induced morphogen